MIYLSGLVGFLLVLTAEAKIGNSSQLEFCTETEQCLLFDPVCETDKFKVLHYDAMKWVSTDEKSYFMEIASIRAFRRLFKYIDGGNTNGQKIQMTAPVIVKVCEGKSFWQTNAYTMSFLLPAEYQASPPDPTDPDVHIQMMPDMKVYSVGYSGWMTGLRDENKAKSLARDLKSMDADYKEDCHYAVGYNSPMTIFNRHNEVWYVVDDEPVCSSSEEIESSPIS